MKIRCYVFKYCLVFCMVFIYVLWLAILVLFVIIFSVVQRRICFLLKGTQHFKKHTFLKNKIKNSKKLTSLHFIVYGLFIFYLFYFFLH